MRFFRPIVLLVFVDMVNVLALADGTADLLLSDPPMDEDVAGRIGVRMARKMNNLVALIRR